ncbi:magnesium/cobalt transporter CorA [Anaerolinea sp.]|uniref:magnesium/cobalt transporter CorA n=1 Tax=Anaerolinea sp. TaxID=1872519 RepID=UPI002ACD9CAF|nr:magnesium/cobalt transporter CorA [Anaerolinea sp.]
MIRSVYYTNHHTIPQANLSIEEIHRALQDPDGLLWVCLSAPTEEELQTILGNLFHFHPLAIEDCASRGFQVSKMDEFGDYLFIVMHALPPGKFWEISEPIEVDLFLGKNYVVSVTHESYVSPIETVWKHLEKDERLITRGSDFLCHAILDHVVDDYLPVLDEIDEQIEFLEDQVLQSPTHDVLSKTLEMKHALMSMRRLVAPQREIMNRLSRDELPMIDQQSRIYFRDIYDHLVRLQDLSESLRDIVTGILDIYLNSTSLRLNEIMKALTIVSTIFLPLSFVAGVYGMNFIHMPELSWRYGYLMVWIIFFLIASGMILFFRKRNWF